MSARKKSHGFAKRINLTSPENKIWIVKTNRRGGNRLFTMVTVRKGLSNFRIFSLPLSLPPPQINDYYQRFQNILMSNGFSYKALNKNFKSLWTLLYSFCLTTNEMTFHEFNVLKLHANDHLVYDFVNEEIKHPKACMFFLCSFFYSLSNIQI